MQSASHTFFQFSNNYHMLLSIAPADSARLLKLTVKSYLRKVEEPGIYEYPNTEKDTRPFRDATELA
jgi:hypothetical protein